MIVRSRSIYIRSRNSTSWITHPLAGGVNSTFSANETGVPHFLFSLTKGILKSIMLLAKACNLRKRQTCYRYGLSGARMDSIATEELTGRQFLVIVVLYNTSDHSPHP
ncbi:MAG: hypothetical protein RH949_11815 [Coleofasciculus sp. A1-SPW-01]|uniref:hypothetical protein n=1 Tax=Coleofasciculus sp. A1-SPW-01 TaxID=3070819 RepID=UPI0032FE70BD